MHTLLQAWKNLVKMFETNTKAKKLQLKSELNNIKRNNISINDYSLNIKSIVEALGSIKVTIDDDDLVGACLTRGVHSMKTYYIACVQGLF